MLRDLRYFGYDSKLGAPGRAVNESSPGTSKTFHEVSYPHHQPSNPHSKSQILGGQLPPYLQNPRNILRINLQLSLNLKGRLGGTNIIRGSDKGEV